MKAASIQWSRLALAFLLTGLLISYLPYPGWPDLPTILWQQLRSQTQETS